MSLFEAILSALKAIWANKMRSALTMLGIIIGIFSVVALISVGESSTASVTDSIEGMGSNLINVMVTNKRVALDLDDVEEMIALDGVGIASPSAGSNATLKSGSENMDVSITAVNSYYDEIRDYNMLYGRFISSNDDDNRLRVVVIGIDVAQEIYGTLDAVEQKISIDGTSFTVIGVLEEQGDSMFGSDDVIALIPYSTGSRIFGDTQIRTIYVSAENSDSIDAAMSSLTNYLLSKSPDGDTDGYKIFSQSQILDTLSETSAILTTMLGGIAGISLLVGGIGIMNIMLVSVTERTREIGIRKAIGATRGNILIQFLIEAIVVSGVGGVIGVVLARIGVNFIGGLMDIPMTISSEIVLIA
ncbi:MAG: ABC transporter permease, partial [Clostridiales bacterium]|nr:ABC transporter permease [Clostridiales bacterium]